MKHPYRARYRNRLAWAALPALFLPALAPAADFTFYAYSDTHYKMDSTAGPTGDSLPARINALPGTPYPPEFGGTVALPKGVVVAGDLVDEGAVADRYPTQWRFYSHNFGVNGEGVVRFPVYDGVGNHDMNNNLFMYNNIKERNLKRKQLGMIGDISPNGYHYSWDWDGIHFVMLNLFPGNIWNGEGDAYGDPHNPMYALDFLKADLKKNVGNSGRPVITIHHYRPIEEGWWVMASVDEYQKALQDYNVIAISVGHAGGGIDNVWRGINWMTSNSNLDVYRFTPDNKLSVLMRGGNGWGQTFQKSFFTSWETSGLPAVVNNGDWAGAITSTSATLSAKLIYDAAQATQVTVYWDTVDGGTSESAWKNSKALGVKAVGDAFTAPITGLVPFKTYYYRAKATNAKGTAWAASSVSFTTKGVLTNWNEEFVGYPQRRGWGANQTAPDAFTVTGTGRDMAEAGQGIDNCEFAYQGVVGDVDLVARVASMPDSKAREPKVGIMLRQSLLDSARNVAVWISPLSGIHFSSRTATGASSNTSAANALKAPYWLRIQRTGNLVTGSVSPNGQTWTAVGAPLTLDLGPTTYAGMAVTAGNRDGSYLYSAGFDHVSLTGKTTALDRGPGASATHALRLAGFAASFPVPDRIGALERVDILSLDGTLRARARLSADGAFARLPDGVQLRPRIYLIRFTGSQGVFATKALAR